MEPFPADRLVVQEAEIWALIFENPRAGITRDMFWSVAINFEPIDISGERYGCRFSIDWLRLPGVKRLEHLSGQDIAGGSDTIEASLYTLEHDPAVWSRIRFAEPFDATIPLTLDARVDMRDSGEWSEAVLHLTTTARFSGVNIHPDLVRDDRKGAADSGGIAREFIDVDAFGPLESFVNQFGVIEFRWAPKVAG